MSLGMTNYNRPSKSFHKIFVLGAGLAMAGGALCVPSASHAGPFAGKGATSTAAPAKGNFMRNLAIGGAFAGAALAGC